MLQYTPVHFWSLISWSIEFDNQLLPKTYKASKLNESWEQIYECLWGRCGVRCITQIALYVYNVSVYSLTSNSIDHYRFEESIERSTICWQKPCCSKKQNILKIHNFYYQAEATPFKINFDSIKCTNKYHRCNTVLCSVVFICIYKFVCDNELTDSCFCLHYVFQMWRWLFTILFSNM